MVSETFNKEFFIFFNSEIFWETRKPILNKDRMIKKQLERGDELGKKIKNKEGKGRVGKDGRKINR